MSIMSVAVCLFEKLILLAQNGLRALTSPSFDHYCQAGPGPGWCEHVGGPSAVSAPGRGAVPALGPGPGTHGGQRAQCKSHDLGRGDSDIRVQHPALLQPVTGTRGEILFVRLSITVHISRRRSSRAEWWAWP